MSVVGLLGILPGDSTRAKFAGTLPWIACGVLLAFAVLGAWSIGFLYVPAAMLFLIAAVVALMLAVIRLLYPAAI